MELLVFDGPPEMLHENIVASSASSIQADLDLPARQHLDEVGWGELTALDALLK